MPRQSVKIGKAHEELIARKYRRGGHRVWRVSDKGFPDLIIMKGRQVVGLVEVKTEKKPLSRHQENLIKKLHAEGFGTRVFWVGKKDGKIIKQKTSSKL